MSAGSPAATFRHQHPIVSAGFAAGRIEPQDAGLPFSKIVFCAATRINPKALASASLQTGQTCLEAASVGTVNDHESIASCSPLVTAVGRVVTRNDGLIRSERRKVHRVHQFDQVPHVLSARRM